MIDIRLPNLQGKSDSEKIRQLTSYIFQLTDQLNYNINTMDEEIRKAGSGSGGSTVIIQGGGGSAGLDRSEVEAIVSSAVNTAINRYYSSIGFTNDGTTLRSTNGVYGSFTGYTVTEEIVSATGYLYTAINGDGTFYYVFGYDSFDTSEPHTTFVSLTKYTRT